MGFLGAAGFGFLSKGGSGGGGGGGALSAVPEFTGTSATVYDLADYGLDTTNKNVAIFVEGGLVGAAIATKAFGSNSLVFSIAPNGQRIQLIY